jgi:hypothetical protein
MIDWILTASLSLEWVAVRMRRRPKIQTRPPQRRRRRPIHPSQCSQPVVTVGTFRRHLAELLTITI